MAIFEVCFLSRKIPFLFCLVCSPTHIASEVLHSLQEIKEFACEIKHDDMIIGKTFILVKQNSVNVLRVLSHAKIHLRKRDLE